MGGLRQKIVDQAKLNDRRFGKGIVCRFIHDDITVDLLNRSNLIPPGTHLNASFNNVKLACDTTRGIYFALPLTALDKYRIELEHYTPDAETGLLSFLRQNMVMIRIAVSKCPKQNPIPNVEIYDILIETVDVSETLDGIFVARTNFNFEDQVQVYE